MPHWHYTDRWQHRLQLTETDVNAAAPLTCQQFFPFFSLSIHFFSPILRLPRALTDFSCTLFFSPCRLGLTRLFICTSFVFGRVCVCVLMTLLINEFPSIFIRLFALPAKAPVSRMYASPRTWTWFILVLLSAFVGARSNNTSSNWCLRFSFQCDLGF